MPQPRCVGRRKKFRALAPRRPRPRRPPTRLGRQAPPAPRPRALPGVAAREMRRLVERSWRGIGGPASPRPCGRCAPVLAMHPPPSSGRESLSAASALASVVHAHERVAPCLLWASPLRSAHLPPHLPFAGPTTGPGRGRAVAVQGGRGRRWAACSATSLASARRCRSSPCWRR